MIHPRIDFDERQLWLPNIPKGYLGKSPLALCSPCIKYAGGKAWIVPLLAAPVHMVLAGAEGGGVYAEPFCGGLAFGLALGWPRSVVSDASADLVNLYASIGVDPGQVSDELEILSRRGFSEETYYEIRREAWPQHRGEISQFAWAARVLYLNKCGFNGLMRCNKKGEFNVPWGQRDGVILPTREHLTRVGEIVSGWDLRCEDFGSVLGGLILQVETGQIRGDSLVVLLDPPYGEAVPDSTARGARARKGGVFTGYAGAFGWEDQVRLAAQAKKLASLGAMVIATNSYTEAVCDLYRDGFEIVPVGVRHSVGATGARRGKRLEMLAVDSAHAHLVTQSDVRSTRKAAKK